jgi:O-antigen/teichoic acid export membrane protein
VRYGTQYFRHTAVQVTTAILVGVMFYVLRVVLYRHLDPEEYGLFYALLAFAAVAHPLLSFGFDPGLIPFVTRFRERNDHAAIKSVVAGSLAAQAIAGGLVVACGLVFARPIAEICFREPEAAGLVRIVALNVGLTLAHKVFFGLLLGLQYVNSRNATELVRVASCLGVTALLLHLGHKGEAAALGYLAGTAAALFVEILAVALLNPGLVRTRLQWRPDLVAAVFRAGKYATIAFGGVTLFSNMDTVMLTLVLPDYRLPVAAYQVAVPTMMILYSLIVAGSTNFMPMATTLWLRGERALLADGIARIHEAAFAVILPATILMACFSDILMAVLFRRDIGAAPEAFAILAPGSVFLFVTHFNLQTLAGIGRTRQACGAIAWAAGANVALNLGLIALFGIRGAAAATVASHALAMILTLRALHRDIPLALNTTALLSITACSASLGLAGVWLRGTWAFMDRPMLTATVASALSYLLLLALFETFGLSRLRELGSVIARGRPKRDRLDAGA